MTTAHLASDDDFENSNDPK